MLFLTTTLPLLLLFRVTQSSLRVAFLSDMHVGESCLPLPYNGTENCTCVLNDRRAVAYVNSLVPLPDAVIITGDITSSAWPTQFAKAREILDDLLPPFFPVMGNHDVWPYVSEGGNETSGPIGDVLFGETFGDVLRASANVSAYNPSAAHNPLWNTTSTFQNYVINLVEPSTGSRLAFLAGDWSTRQPAPKPNDGVPGWAERGLSDFPGGTLPWLRGALEALAAQADRPQKLFLVQHQPVACPFWVPDFLFCFGAADKALLEKALLEKFTEDEVWGVFAGHNHVFQNVTVPFDHWPDFRQVEVSAAKGDALDSDVASSVITVDFVGSRVDLITEHYYSISKGSWVVTPGL